MFEKGNVVEVKGTGEQGEVVMVCDTYKQVEVDFGDSMDVFNYNKIFVLKDERR